MKMNKTFTNIAGVLLTLVLTFVLFVCSTMFLASTIIVAGLSPTTVMIISMVLFLIVSVSVVHTFECIAERLYSNYD